MKAKLAAMISAAAAAGQDVLTDLLATLKAPGETHRKRWHSHKTRMPDGRGARLDALRRRTPPGSPGKINFRRSDPRHPKHEKLFHNGADCTCAAASAE